MCRSCLFTVSDLLLWWRVKGRIGVMKRVDGWDLLGWYRHLRTAAVGHRLLVVVAFFTLSDANGWVSVEFSSRHWSKVSPR